MFFPGIAFSSSPGCLSHPQLRLCAYLQAQLLVQSLPFPFLLQEGTCPLASGETLPPRELRFIDIMSEKLLSFPGKCSAPTDAETEVQVVRGMAKLLNC